MANLNFTPEQRLIIALLCDLYKEPKDREFRPDKLEIIMEAIYGGHDWAIDWELSGLFPEEIDSKDDVSFVVDVLDMWTFIERRWPTLSDEEQEKIRASTPVISEPKFLGFDGNNETNLMAIARMLVEKMGRFSKFKGRELNSHMPTAERYRNMLVHWPAIRRTLADADLSIEQMITLLSRD